MTAIMELARQLALLAAMGFFALGLLGGVWKYAKIRRSPTGQAPAYVDIFHRSTLLYAFACALLERMVEIGELPAWLEVGALVSVIGFFGFAVFGYAVHGWLEDTDNQLRRPHRLGAGTISPTLVHGSMVALVTAELGGFLLLACGVLRAM